MASKLLSLLLLSGLATAAPPIESRHRKPLAFILAGDSTTAVQQAGAGGWGTGFLSTLRSPSYGVNKGHPGATTASFVSRGDWDECLELVKNATDKYEVYVTIQFGHNDQKSTSGVTIEEFQTNLENLAADVEDLGATPLMFTALTRRNFNGADLIDDLSDVVPAARDAAAAAGVTLIDLNAASREYVQAIGSADADEYNLRAGDTSHLNDHGSVVFGQMVADLIIDSNEHLGWWIHKNATISNAIAKGIYI